MQALVQFNVWSFFASASAFTILCISLLSFAHSWSLNYSSEFGYPHISLPLYIREYFCDCGYSVCNFVNGYVSACPAALKYLDPHTHILYMKEDVWVQYNAFMFLYSLALLWRWLSILIIYINVFIWLTFASSLPILKLILQFVFSVEYRKFLTLKMVVLILFFKFVLGKITRNLTWIQSIKKEDYTIFSGVRLQPTDIAPGEAMCFRRVFKNPRILLPLSKSLLPGLSSHCYIGDSNVMILWPCVSWWLCKGLLYVMPPVSLLYL